MDTTWYVDDAGAAVVWGTAVAGGKATQRITRFVQRTSDSGSVSYLRFLWRADGALVSDEDLAAAQAEESADPVPTEPDPYSGASTDPFLTKSDADAAYAPSGHSHV